MTDNQLVIGLAGRSRAGKTTVADHLAATYGLDQRAFGDGVKRAALALDPIIGYAAASPDPGFEPGPPRLTTMVQQIGWEAAKETPEVRRTLQRLGTEAGWMIHGRNLWVDLVASQITRPTVITDIRFPHGAEWVRSVGGSVWLIQRPSGRPAMAPDTAGHASEELRVSPQAVIDNTGTLERLRAEVDALYRLKAQSR